MLKNKAELVKLKKNNQCSDCVPRLTWHLFQLLSLSLFSYILVQIALSLFS